MFKLNQKYLNEVTEGGDSDSAPTENQQPMVDPLEYEKLKQENQSIKSKMNELLSETKKAKAERSRAQEEAAKKNGDFEQLFESQKQKTQEWQTRFEELNGQIASEKVNTEALKIASNIADGANAELLATFVKNRLKYSEEGVQVLDNSGQLTVSSLDDLANEFKQDPKFSSLVKSPNSVGGGATGNSSGASGSAKVMTRSDFDKADPSKRMTFIKSGGSLIE